MTHVTHDAWWKVEHKMATHRGGASADEVKRLSSEANHNDVFAKIDAYVSKPVLGSDGAAQWQKFREEQPSHAVKRSVAPTAPISAANRKAGFTSWDAERERENQVRSQDKSAAKYGEVGYTSFKKSADPSTIAKRKENESIINRIRPEEVPYFIPSSTYDGSKFDYVFTTRSTYGTGYYWDGTDSKNKLLSQQTNGEDAEEHSATNAPIPEKKKKKRSRDLAPVIPEDDPYNPRAQVAALLQQRRQIHDAPSVVPSQLSPPTEQWESATDPATGNTYYYNASTGERTWTKPGQVSKATMETNQEARPDTAAPKESQLDEGSTNPLPTGWKTATDPASGKEYYYHAATGQTSWEFPLQAKSEGGS
jgi:WW domain